MVSVNDYGELNHITFPLLFKEYKPRTRLKPGDTYKTKLALAVEIVQELQAYGFCFDVVLAGCLSGESGDFISELEKVRKKLCPLETTLRKENEHTICLVLLVGLFLSFGSCSFGRMHLTLGPHKYCDERKPYHDAD